MASEGTLPTRRRTMTRSTRTLQIAAALAACASLLAPLKAQRGGGLPFAPGEACTYRGNSPLGRMGSGTFSVARDSASEGNWVLRFDFRGRMGIVGVENHTRSYFDPAETASFRFTKM